MKITIRYRERSWGDFNPWLGKCGACGDRWCSPTWNLAMSIADIHPSMCRGLGPALRRVPIAHRIESRHA